MKGRSTRWCGGLVIAVLAVAAGGVAGPASGAPGPVGGSPGTAGGLDRVGVESVSRVTGQPSRSVTLITGDRVTVSPDGEASVRPGPGRTGVSMHVRREGGRLRVVPADAAPLLRAGRLDPRLFDVTGLLEFGYDDRRGDLPLIFTADAGGAARGRTLARQAGAEVVRELPAVDGVAVRAAKAGLADLWRDVTGGVGASSLRGGVSRVWLDGVRTLTLEHSVPQIGAPAAWQDGYDGTGVTVAVLDTGVDADHPDLAGQVVGQANFTEEDGRDLHGHGTHVASTIAGTGAASGGRNRGVAPGAKLLSGKVCDSGTGCAESSILAGMQWAAEQGATVVNMSLGGSDTPEVDPLEEAVQALTDEYGTLFVIAAGNDEAEGTINSPGSAEAALTVGALDRDGNLADFSSRGPRIGDGGLKPDITAPGVDIRAARSGDAYPGDPDPYLAMSGTSMATPHVTGAAAILAQRHPRWRAAALKATLMASAVPNPELGVFAQGAGRVDVARAIQQSVAADPASIGFGRQLWPHDDDTPVTKTVTYTNSGSAPVTVELSVPATGPEGVAAPAGMFTVSASTVTVPAGGTATVTVTADTRVAAPDGRYTGRLVASVDGTPVVQTPFAVEREVESYDVTLTHLDRTGAETAWYFTDLLRDEDLTPYFIPGPDATVTLRVPRGRYILLSTVYEQRQDDDSGNPAPNELSVLAQPVVDVTGPTRLTVDARRAAPVSITVSRPDAARVVDEVSVEVGRDDDVFLYTQFGGEGDRMYSGQLGDAGPVDGFDSWVASIWAKADAEVDSPFSHHLAWFRTGSLFTGFTRTVRDSELAVVTARYAQNAAGPGVTAEAGAWATQADGSRVGWYILLPFTPPLERTEYYNTDGGIRWNHRFNEWVPDDDMDPLISSYRADGVQHRPGVVTQVQWNQGVFGPTFAERRNPLEWATRLGDEISVGLWMFGDGAGRSGWSAIESASLTLYRNGVKIGEFDDLEGDFEVPAEAADYRIEATATRGAPFSLSTRVEAAWTFRSGHVPGETPHRLPLSTVRFSPPLDQTNTAPAGRWFSIPFSVLSQPGSDAAGIRSVAVDVSYDDGRTWHRARVVASGGTGQVLLRHPEQAGFVSLRATATDRSGNTVRQTVLRAYAIAP
ncbi:peptidase S8 [Micromonospora sp. HM5-17]|nr:peptidase S8 [Micromonospora sp. HM5-17]